MVPKTTFSIPGVLCFLTNHTCPTCGRDAKTNTACKLAYRHLSQLHDGFAELSKHVFESDRVSREIADLETKLEIVAKQPVDLTTVESDLEAIRRENDELEKRLKDVA